MKKYWILSILVAFVMFFTLGTSTFAATQHVYVYKGSEIVYRTTADNLDSVALEQNKTIISLYSKNGTRLYSAAYSEIDSITYVTLPQADLLDVQFNADGTATDISPMANTIQAISGAGLKTYFNNGYQHYVARFDNTWAGTPTGYYKIDYSQNQKFQDLLAQGHSMEAVVMADYGETIPNAEAKFFSSHEGGGTGFLVSTISGNRQNEWTFLPNVTTTGSSTWRWATSGIVPQAKVYYHLVGVWNKITEKAEIYINGKLMNSVDAPGNFKFPTSNCYWFALGCDPSANGGAQGWIGDIVVARIYSEALSQNEVAALYKDVSDINAEKPADYITNVTLQSGYNVDEGSTIEIGGTGFQDGDKIIIRSTNQDATQYTIEGTITDQGISVKLPQTLTTGTFRIAVSRNSQEQDLGVSTIKINDKSEKPIADMLDVKFNEDGTATDISPMANPIETISGLGLSTYYNKTYQRYVARFENTWAGTPTGYYKMDYATNQNFKNLLSNGHTIEAVVMANFTGDIPNKECKPFSSMQAGGTGFMITTVGGTHQNEWCFLPNITETGNSTWRWATSTITPESKTYYHLVGVWNKTTGKAEIYVDGQLMNTVDAPGNFKFPSDGANWFGIGCDPTTTGGEAAWCGDVVLARIYSTPLNDNQISALWSDVKKYEDNPIPDMITDIDMESGFQVEKGSLIQIDGKGFQTGDKIEFYSTPSNQLVSTFNTTLNNTGLYIEIVKSIANGTYRIYLDRNGEKQYLGFTTITYIDKTVAPVADMLDVVFNYDGTAKDVSAMANTIQTVGANNVSTYYNSTYKRFVGHFNNNWASTASGYFKMDYTNNQTFRNLLSNGQTLEALVMADYDGSIPNQECKPFSSMQAGGTGFLVTTISGDRQNELCFLPNTSTNGSSTWRWATSGVVPLSKVYYHIVGVWNQAEQRAYIYVNGELKGSVDAPGNFNFPAAGSTWFALGADPDGASNATAAWNGDIVLARIYSSALDEDQVGKLWTEIKDLQDNAVPDMITEVSIDGGYQVKPASNFDIKGKGFQNGDKIVIYDPSKDNSIVATLTPTTITDSGVSIILPSNLNNGTYTIYVNRNGQEQYLATNAFQFVETLPTGSKVIAHRGYWSILQNKTQNSIESLQKAMDMGFYGSETDVWITTDGHLMINHDPSFDGVTIETASFDDCYALKLSNGETMPQLDDFLDLLSSSTSNTKLIIEIKTHTSSERGLAAAEAVINKVKEYEVQDRVEYIAFSLNICKKLVELDPTAKVSYLNGDMTPQQLHDLGISGLDYTAAQFQANPSWITDAHNLGMTANVWTLDSRSDIIQFNNLGADFITTNNPETADEVKKHYEDAQKQ
ncbi:MAG: LamG-like jellyroll fold domain-containing protein [Bacteroidaceae bacterium]|jgi:glycerophosphoryl diester phosphodiesterase